MPWEMCVVSLLPLRQEGGGLLREPSDEIGAIQGRFAWPLRKDDARKSNSVGILSLADSQVGVCAAIFPLATAITGKMIRGRSEHLAKISMDWRKRHLISGPHLGFLGVGRLGFLGVGRGF